MPGWSSAAKTPRTGAAPSSPLPPPTARTASRCSMPGWRRCAGPWSEWARTGPASSWRVWLFWPRRSREEFGMTVDAPPMGEQIMKRRLWIILGALLLGMLLAALDQTIVSTALPTIVGDLHGGSHLAWVVTAYLLGSAVATPLWGKLGDQYGRKIFFQAAIVIFLAGSILSGLSHTMIELIAFRAIQGLGAGGLMV